MKRLFNKYSTSNQDIFAYQIGGLRGNYLEIGAADAVRGSNTYILEREYGWNGISLELNKDRHLDSWKIRKNPIYWSNALEFDYQKALKENNIQHIDYLQLDIEPAKNTYEALTLVISQGIDFKCCTFEHDHYNKKEEDLDYKILADELLEKNGYKIAVENVVSRKNNKYYETWYVKKDIEWQQRDFKEWLKEVEIWTGHF